MPEDWRPTDGGAGAVSGGQDRLQPGLLDAGPAEAGSPARADDVPLRVNLAQVQQVIWIVIGTLIALDFLAAVLSAYNVLPFLILRFFDGDQKVNFPTGGKTTFLLLNTVLMVACWVAGRSKGDPSARGWALLAAGTGFAFIDETTYLHQSLSEGLLKAFHFTGVLRYSWTIVYAPAAIVIAMFLFRNLQLIREDVRKRLILGGGLFVAGALLLEPVKSKLSDSTVGDQGLAFRLTAAVSDSLELTGLAVLAGGMLIALSVLTARFSLELEEIPAPAPRAPRSVQSFQPDQVTHYPVYGQGYGEGYGQAPAPAAGYAQPSSPSGQYSAAQYPSAQYSAAQYPGGQYAGDQYGTGQYPAGQPGASQQTAGQYAGGQYPDVRYGQPAQQAQYDPYAQPGAGQYPGTGQYGGQQQPTASASPDGQYAAQYGQPYAIQPASQPPALPGRQHDTANPYNGQAEQFSAGQQAGNAPYASGQYVNGALPGAVGGHEPGADAEDPLWAPTQRRPMPGNGR